MMIVSPAYRASHRISSRRKTLMLSCASVAMAAVAMTPRACRLARRHLDAQG